jgi:hypothetical protein
MEREQLGSVYNDRSHHKCATRGGSSYCLEDLRKGLTDSRATGSSSSENETLNRVYGEEGVVDTGVSLNEYLAIQYIGRAKAAHEDVDTSIVQAILGQSRLPQSVLEAMLKD